MEDVLFTEKETVPSDKLIEDHLGESFSFWLEIISFVENTAGPVTTEWKFYGKKIGWTRKLLFKKRNLLFFTPHYNYFSVSMVFGDKAVAAIEKSHQPSHIINQLVNARKYAEGRGIRLDVKSKEDTEIIKELLAVKIEN